MVTEFECRRCGIVVSLEKYESDRFCPNCGTLLRPKRLKIDGVRAGKEKERIEIHRDDINIDSLWYEYTHRSPIDVGSARSIVLFFVPSFLLTNSEIF